MPDYSREELVTELKRRRAARPIEVQPSHVPYSWETPEASLRRIEGIPEGYGETEPWIDPTSVFAAGAGTGLRAGLQAGKPLVSAAMQGLRSGLAGAAMDYPVGTVAGAVGEKYPAAAFPLSVGLGIASGKYIEPKLEAGLRKLPEYAAEAAPYARMKLAEQRGSFSTKSVEEPEYKPFYSQLENVIESKVQTQKPVDPEAFKQILKPEHGVKQDELTNTKIKDFLEGKKVVGEKVSKNDVLDYLKEQRTELKDVVLGGDMPEEGLRVRKEVYAKYEPEIKRLLNIMDSHPSQEERWRAGELHDNLIDIRDSEADKAYNIRQTEFSSYQEPGGTNYREMFVTAPEGREIFKEVSPSDFKIVTTKESQYTGQRDTDIYYQGEKIGSRSGTRASDDEIRDSYVKNIKESREDFVKKQKNWQDGHSQYSDIQNPVVRLRFNERTDDAGRKILFIEEIQGPSKDNAAKMPEWLQKRQYDMGVKRILKYAADNGFDGISWTPGSIQASRYDLSKEVDSINYEGKWVDVGDLKFEPVFKYEAIKNDKAIKPFSDKWLTQKELADEIGKDIAEKINTSVYGREQQTYPVGTLSGLDLEVGGEGLKSLYDKILPKKFQEITRGKVGETKINKLGDIPFIPVPKEAKKGYPLYAAIPALGLAGQEEEQPQYSRAELVEELKRRRQTK